MDDVILRSTYRRRLDAGSDKTWFGTFDLELDRTPESSGASDVPSGSRLALWCSTQVEPGDASGVRVVERLAGHLVLEPIDGGAPPSWSWRIDGLRSRFPARHANDGPEAAWLILSDGSTVVVDVEPSRAADPPSSAPTEVCARRCHRCHRDLRRCVRPPVGRAGHAAPPPGRVGIRSGTPPTGQTNYLDMAPGRAWELPGGSWADPRRSPTARPVSHDSSPSDR